MRRMAELQVKRERKAAERRRLANHRRHVTLGVYSMDRNNHAIAQRKHQERRQKERRAISMGREGTD